MNKKTDNKFSEIKPRIIQVLEYKSIPKEEFYIKIGMTSASFRGSAKYTPLNSTAIENILSEIPDLNAVWLLTGKGNMLDEENQHITKKKVEKEIETRPRIPYDAAAGSLSVALDGITIDHCEQLPVIRAFAKYDFTIIAKGDSMLPEFHSGDELACLYVKDSKFIQWGRVHVLDTSQGVVVKRIFKGDDCFICRSDNPNYPEFNIDGSELYNVALVIGVIRRY